MSAVIRSVNASTMFREVSTNTARTSVLRRYASGISPVRMGCFGVEMHLTTTSCPAFNRPVVRLCIALLPPSTGGQGGL